MNATPSIDVEDDSAPRSEFFTAEHYATLRAIGVISNVPEGLHIYPVETVDTRIIDDLMQWGVIVPSTTEWKLSPEAADLFSSVRGFDTHTYVTGTIKIVGETNQTILTAQKEVLSVCRTPEQLRDYGWVFNYDPVPTVRFVFSINAQTMTIVANAGGRIKFSRILLHDSLPVHAVQELKAVLEMDESWAPLDGVNITLTEEELSTLRGLPLEQLRAPIEDSSKQLSYEKDILATVQTLPLVSSSSKSQIFSLMKLDMYATVSMRVDRSTTYGMAPQDRYAGLDFYYDYGMVANWTKGTRKDGTFLHKYVTATEQALRDMFTEFLA